MSGTPHIKISVAVLQKLDYLLVVGAGGEVAKWQEGKHYLYTPSILFSVKIVYSECSYKFASSRRNLLIRV